MASGRRKEIEMFDNVEFLGKVMTSLKNARSEDNLGSRSSRSITEDDEDVDGSRLSTQQQERSTCHQCRQKTRDLKAHCTTCSKRFCYKCLRKKYNEDIDEIDPEAWRCPSCRSICSCSVCRRKTTSPQDSPYLVSAGRTTLSRQSGRSSMPPSVRNITNGVGTRPTRRSNGGGRRRSKYSESEDSATYSSSAEDDDEEDDMVDRDGDYGVPHSRNSGRYDDIDDMDDDSGSIAFRGGERASRSSSRGALESSAPRSNARMGLYNNNNNNRRASKMVDDDAHNSDSSFDERPSSYLQRSSRGRSNNSQQQRYADLAASLTAVPLPSSLSTTRTRSGSVGSNINSYSKPVSPSLLDPNHLAAVEQTGNSSRAIRGANHGALSSKRNMRASSFSATFSAHSRSDSNLDGRLSPSSAVNLKRKRIGAHTGTGLPQDYQPQAMDVEEQRLSSALGHLTPERLGSRSRSGSFSTPPRKLSVSSDGRTASTPPLPGSGRNSPTSIIMRPISAHIKKRRLDDWSSERKAPQADSENSNNNSAAATPRQGRSRASSTEARLAAAAAAAAAVKFDDDEDDTIDAIFDENDTQDTVPPQPQPQQRQPVPPAVSGTTTNSSNGSRCGVVLSSTPAQAEEGPHLKFTAKKVVERCINGEMYFCVTWEESLFRKSEALQVLKPVPTAADTLTATLGATIVVPPAATAPSVSPQTMSPPASAPDSLMCSSPFPSAFANNASNTLTVALAAHENITVKQEHSIAYGEGIVKREQQGQQSPMSTSPTKPASNGNTVATRPASPDTAKYMLPKKALSKRTYSTDNITTNPQSDYADHAALNAVAALALAAAAAPAPEQHHPQPMEIHQTAAPGTPGSEKIAVDGSNMEIGRGRAVGTSPVRS